MQKAVCPVAMCLPEPKAWETRGTLVFSAPGWDWNALPAPGRWVKKDVDELEEVQRRSTNNKMRFSNHSFLGNVK